MGSLDSTERTMLLTPDAQNFAFARGHLLFFRDATLMAQPFDTGRLALTGEAFPVAESVQMIPSNFSPLGLFATSESGFFVYQVGAATTPLSEVAKSPSGEILLGII